LFVVVSEVSVTLWHTNDLHGRLRPQQAERVRQLVSQSQNPLLLDAGDAISAPNIFWRLGGEPVLDLMASLPYAAMCLGNREFHLWEMGLRRKLAQAKHPVLCANIRSRRGRLPAFLGPRLLVTIEGVSVAIIGLTVPMVTSRMAARALSHFLFDDPVEVARREVEALRGSAALVIALTHLGLKMDRLLLESVPGIALVVGGHSHTPLPQPQAVGAGYVVQAPAWARGIGRVELTLRAGRLCEVKGEIVAL